MRKIIFVFVLIQSFVLTLVGQTISTNAEIYNFDIGDIFHYFEIMSGSGSSTNIESNIIITAKYYSLNNDTLYYVRNIAKRESNSFDTTVVYIYLKDTVSYSNLLSPVNAGIIDSVFIDITKYNGSKINQDTTNYFDLYVESLGKAKDMIYYDPITLTEHSINLVYYKKGNEVWGNPVPISIDSKTPNDVYIKAYPNPVSTIINFEFKTTISESFTVTIYNLLVSK